MLNNYTNRLIAFSILFTLTQLIRFLKVNYLLGSLGAFFTGSQFLIPLSGLYGGVEGSLYFILAQKIFFYTLYGGSFLVLEKLYIPTLSASLYLSTDHWIVRMLIPLICMTLFLMHPVGVSAWFYSLYWLIPIMVYFFGGANLFFVFLGATFTAHAVGSVIWLYINPLTVQDYWMLMPIVLVERLLFTSGLYCMHTGIWYITKSIEKQIYLYTYKSIAR
jgi:hypothetical protein